MSVKELISAILLISVTIASAVPKPTTIDEDAFKTQMGTNDRALHHEDQPPSHQELGDDLTKTLDESIMNTISMLQDSLVRTQRSKRKVIFGGGSYGHSGRRGGGAGGDPYGRRRGHYGDQGPYDSWPYRRPDFPSSNAPIYGTQRSSDISGGSSTVKPTDVSTRNTAKAPNKNKTTHDDIYGTIRTTPAHTVLGLDDERSSGGKSSSSNSEKRKNNHKLTKVLKLEIAKFALQYGMQRAAEKYSEMVERTLQPKKIEKFIKRYQKQQMKDRGN